MSSSASKSPEVQRDPCSVCTQAGFRDLPLQAETSLCFLQMYLANWCCAAMFVQRTLKELPPKLKQWLCVKSYPI